MGYAGIWACLIFALYTKLHLEFLAVPFLPIATLGTAVAFYVGFKNNAAYERFWEGRKIWGGIVNESRSWATHILAYIPEGQAAEPTEEKRNLIKRQLAWVNSLRIQLRAKSRFEDGNHPKVKARLERDRKHMRNDWDSDVANYLSAEEAQAVKGTINPATHILMAQASAIARLQRTGTLDLFHQIDLMAIHRECLALQGKCERIKNTPFPRQYAVFSLWFTRVFIALLPFGLLNVFVANLEKTSMLGGLSHLVSMVIASALLTWVFATMEGIGDASEDPFERSMNDVPMNNLCRVIERDLLQLLGGEKIPEPEAPSGFLMY